MCGSVLRAKNTARQITPNRNDVHTTALYPEPSTSAMPKKGPAASATAVLMVNRLMPSP